MTRLTMSKKMTTRQHARQLTRQALAQKVAHQSGLEPMKFHYFLGYARNFRELYFDGKLPGRKTPDRVFRLIDVDAKVSEVLYSGIRNAEWLLRHYLVQEYCERFESRGSFLDFENYLNLGDDYTNDHLARGLMNDILDYSETYVVEQLAEVAKALKCPPPKRCDVSNWEHCKNLSEDLALWSVVDSFSLGRLVKLIQRCDSTADDKQRIWRKIAADMDIPAGRFGVGMESLRSLRNLVSHQSRLWLRPTTNTVSKKGQFHKKIGRCHRNPYPFGVPIG
ncbi:Abi family protein [Corynebacterium pseudotuberculosis]|nr:Abi family protein [Corynebacterium pseudotuberculosis]AEX39031.1 Abi-like protein [Corynebacterium pseudotuberculosis 3/99-5]AIG06932.1 hypothetical protein CPTA_01103 [Corynebacterium pseudotuberculosis]AIG08486.1 hypothetical protein CPTB_00430 [Corynebacterium pseudotuberculosis]AIG10377.1 hypothetical protein CPTC_00089 [Corynebacterium pseudotuberculosis]AKC73308.1 Abi-like protein, domain-containing protein [Corynebacterium pseudotuberculosis]